MRRVLGNEELARSLSANGPPIEVHVELVRSATTASGYQWTSTLTSGLPSLLLAGLSAAGSGLARAATAIAAVLPPEWTAGRPTAWTFELPAWTTNLTTSHGPPITIETGTPCEAQVIVEEQAPISQVIAKLNR